MQFFSTFLISGTLILGSPKETKKTDLWGLPTSEV